MLEMEQLVSYKGWVVAGAFVLIFMFEHIRPAVRGVFEPARRIIKNMSFWPLNIGLSLLVIIPVSYYAGNNAVWQRPDWWSGGWGLIIDILILDIFLYIWHRAMHEIQFFWRFHEVHHLDTHLDSTSALRFHFGEIFLATLFRVMVILLFSLPFSSVVIFETVVLICTFFHHSNMALPSWFERPLSKIIVTPSIHWVHHHAIRKDTDSNYSTLFSIWDRVFNSQSKTQRSQNMKIGVEGSKDTNFKRLLIWPFYRK